MKMVLHFMRNPKLAHILVDFISGQLCHLVWETLLLFRNSEYRGGRDNIYGLVRKVVYITVSMVCVSCNTSESFSVVPVVACLK